LTRKNTFYCRYGVFKVRAGHDARRSSPSSKPAGLSKLNSVNAELDVGSRPVCIGRLESHHGRRRKVAPKGIPRRRPNKQSLSE